MSSKFRPENPLGEGHVKHRETARVFLTNPAGQLLLMLTHWDPGTGLPPRWLTPGGGIDAGEAVIDAAVRELFEETGMVVSPEDLGQVVHTIDFLMDWDENRFETGRAYFYSLAVTEDFQLDNAAWTIDEHRDVIEWRWWSVSELIASGERVGPPGLLEHLEHHF
jgi:8-oxo-dGTP pyrophosphatase MutT (NUDIX family)